MEMFPTDSSLIASYGYDPKTRELRLDFHNGGVYSYADVPQEDFEAFLRSPSKGKHFLADIKGKFTFTKL